MSVKEKDVEMSDVVSSSEENGNGHEKSKNNGTTTTTTTSSSNKKNHLIDSEDSSDSDSDSNKRNKQQQKQQDDDNIEDEDDELLMEIPVYLTNELADNLVLFQYPLRQPWRPYDMSRLEELRIKPKQQKVEMDISLDTDNEHYDSDSRNKSKKTTLSSTSISHRTNYSIGLMKRYSTGSELHITPLQSIIQLRPNFSEFDEKWLQDKAAKKSQEKQEDDDEESEESSSSHPNQPIYRKPTAKSAAAAAAAAPLNYLKRLEDEEKWIKVTSIDEPDLMDEKQLDHFNKLICKHKTENIPFELDESQYFEFLCPKAQEDWVPKKIHTKDVVSLEMIHNMSTWQSQLKAILLNGHCMTFTKIMSLLSIPSTSSNDIMEQDIVAVLEQLAILIRGRWIIRSEFVYPKEEDHQISRDYLLLLFYENEYVRRQDLTEKTHISAEFARELFCQISDVNLQKRAWSLKKTSDDEFISRYPSLISKFDSYFRTQKGIIKRNVEVLSDPSRHSVYNMLTKEYNNVNGVNNDNVNTSTITTTQSPAITNIPTSYREGKTVEQQLLFFVYNLFKVHGVCSNQFIKQSIAKECDSPVESLLINVNDDMVTALLVKICQQAHHSYFLKTSGNPNTDKYRNVVIDIFKKKIGVTRNDIQSICKEMLGEEAPNSILTPILQELAIAKNKTTWIFKSNLQ